MTTTGNNIMLKPDKLKIGAEWSDEQTDLAIRILGGVQRGKMAPADAIIKLQAHLGVDQELATNTVARITKKLNT